MADKISQSCQGGFIHYQKCHMHTITMPPAMQANANNIFPLHI